MKTILITILLFIFFTSISNSQTYNLITARDGYDALLSGVPGLDQQFDLVSAEAIGFVESVLEIDFESGKATMWTFLFKSKDLNDTAFYEFVVYNIDGEFFIESEIDINSNSQNFVSLSIDWKDSDILGTELQKNTNLMKFYNDKIDSIAQMAFNLNHSNEFSSDVWQVGILTNEQSFAMCSYNSVTLSLLNCDLPSSVEEFVSEKIRLYPNPATDFVNIALPFSGEVRLELFNTNGEILKSGRFFSSDILNYNISGINSGVYNLVIKSETAVYSKVIVIIR